MTAFWMRPEVRPSEVLVQVERGLLGRAPVERLPRRSTGVLVADGAVAARVPVLQTWLRGLITTPAEPILIPAGEDTKEAGNLLALWAALWARDLDRTSLIVVAGGGSVLDAGMFLAATYLRGLEVVAIPTSLLAQVDAGLGGKCGVNLGGAKNQIGVTRQPLAVIVDPELLRTLPQLEWLSGLGEVAKTALLAGGDLLDRVRGLDAARGVEDPALEAVIEGCLRFKASVVERDEGDRSARAMLNLGHTVAHVMEGLALAQRVPLPHGVAVAAGILAETRNLASGPGMVECVGSLLQGLGLPERAGVAWDPLRAADLLRRDKKRAGGTLRIPVIDEPGRVRFVDAGAEQLLGAARDAALGGS